MLQFFTALLFRLLWWFLFLFFRLFFFFYFAVVIFLQMFFFLTWKREPLNVSQMQYANVMPFLWCLWNAEKSFFFLYFSFVFCSHQSTDTVIAWVSYGLWDCYGVKMFKTFLRMTSDIICSSIIMFFPNCNTFSIEKSNSNLISI